jgi:hypothetical protein
MNGTLWRGMLVAAAIAAAGCASPAPSAPPRPVNLQGFAPAFKAGYADGCESVRLGSTQRSEERYKTDFDYAQGWNDGHSICARRK